jgi:hypothetical protein
MGLVSIAYRVSRRNNMCRHVSSEYIGAIGQPRQAVVRDPCSSRPKHLAFPLDLPPIESEIVDAVLQSEKFIRGEAVESCKSRYFNLFEFFDHTGAERP